MKSVTSKRGKQFWLFWERFGILAILTLTLIVFTLIDPIIYKQAPRILITQNLLNVLCRSAIVGIPAMGMTFAICSGGFDLSIGSIVGLSTCVWSATVPVIGLIPATLEATTLGELRPGGRVNIEVDILARYVDRLMRCGAVG